MLSLNQTTGYAILALGMLEGPGGKPVLVRAIAEAARIPKPYLSKMINALAAKGLVETKRGYRGGVTLARPAHKITLMDIAQAVEGSRWSMPCLLGLTECSDERACPLHAFWVRTVERINRELGKITLARASQFQCCLANSPAAPAKARRGAAPVPAKPAARRK
jgi:Rrf2 family transcriptional regulator, iron-sulfur cluster assembly transcription factor